MLFPTVRFALFFAVVMPVSWMLMPLPGRPTSTEIRDETQRWLAPVGLLGVAALLGPFAPVGGWPTWARAALWLLALAIAAAAVVRWADLRGLARWNVFILVASYVFYGAYDWRFVGLLIVSTLVNQVMAGLIERSERDVARRLALAGAVAANLGVLAWFKYKGFFLEASSGVLEPFGIDIEPPARALIPPVGISFFTFQALSYVIDIYRRQLHRVPLLEFAVYLSFFPQFVAGPIVRASEFLPQLRKPRDPRRVDTGLAFWLIAVGLFKKVVVSAYLADAIVDPVFRIPSQHQAGDTLLGIYGYAIQIYCDFSGYTDMAIGLALLLGFSFPQNFDAPYTASTLQEFWRRWHMTLSRWLRDYLYVPLGGNQRGPSRAYVNVFMVMLIGGLWHGAAWTFVIWGALHGGYLAAERWWHRRPKPSGPGPAAAAPPPEPSLSSVRGGPGAGTTDLAFPEADAPDPLAEVGPRLSPTARLWLGRALTFNIVCLAWVFFRAPTASEAFEVLSRLFSFGTGTGINLVVVATIAFFLATQFVPATSVGRLQAGFSRLPFWAQGGLLGLWLAFTSALSPPGVAPFIYFNF